MKSLNECVKSEERKYGNGSEDIKRKRLLFMLCYDLLSPTSGEVLKWIDGKANGSIYYWPSFVYYFTLGFIVAADLVLLAYILWSTWFQSNIQQLLWLWTFLLWFVLDILVISSISILYSYMIVPSLIIRDVMKIKNLVVNYLSSPNVPQNDIEHKSDSVGSFNAADYLYMSPLLSRKFNLTDNLNITDTTTDNMTDNVTEYKYISRKIISYKTIWPHYITPVQNRDPCSVFLNHYFLGLFARIFIRLPLIVFDFVFELLIIIITTAILIGGVLLFRVDLWACLAFIIALLLMAILLLFWMYWYNYKFGYIQSNDGTMQNTSPSATTTNDNDLTSIVVDNSPAKNSPHNRQTHNRRTKNSPHFSNLRDYLKETASVESLGIQPNELFRDNSDDQFQNHITLPRRLPPLPQNKHLNRQTKFSPHFANNVHDSLKKSDSNQSLDMRRHQSLPISILRNNSIDPNLNFNITPIKPPPSTNSKHPNRKTKQTPYSFKNHDNLNMTESRQSMDAQRNGTFQTSYNSSFQDNSLN